MMPSRAGADGLGGFSYYEHVCLPENLKELVWEHGGRVFRTQVVIRLSGRSRRTEAFLFEQSEKSWSPVVLADGTVSDGKVETYERAVSEVLCPAETFFTSVFSAQGKRPLSALRNAEVKTLLADLLGLDEVRRQGELAADVVRQLKAGLGVAREAGSRLEENIHKLREELAAIGNAGASVQTAAASLSESTTQLAAARERVTALTAEQARGTEIQARRTALEDERQKCEGEHLANTRRLLARQDALARREAATRSRIGERLQAEKRHRQKLQGDLSTLTQLVELRDPVQQAHAALPRLQRRVARCRQLGIGRQRQLTELERQQSTLAVRREEIAAIEREAGQVALRQADLQRRFGLTRSVPCAGMAIQSRCRLLGDAHQAQAQLPSAAATLAALAAKKHEAGEEVKRLQRALQGLDARARAHERALHLLMVAQDALRKAELLAARADEVDRALAAREAIAAELHALGPQREGPLPNEQGELEAIASERREIEQEGLRLARTREQTQARLAAELARLPVAPAEEGLRKARQELAHAESAYAQAQQRVEQAQLRAARATALGEQLAQLKGQAAAASERVAHIEGELAAWSLLAKCLSNDGVIALAIDDAGPTLAALANDLLLACYGARFTLEVITQTRTAKGELREDFDIIVHDGWRDESKSLKLVSGGERVWINECLTRAIALYLAGNTGRRIGTLFSDEADGPLDPQRKRMFMAMKREVLRLGGYEREFFVTQTPELTAMADCVIDLEALVEEEGQGRVEASG
ncbi:MAG TPA: DNA repair protein [Rubrivivax sp.]|nr:DNA repair protein [Rubrivivax sp.]